MQRCIQSRDALFTKKIEYVLWCYSEKQPDLFNSMKNVDFHQGLTEELLSESNLKGRNTILVLDDLAQEIDKQLLTRIYTKYSHHRGIRWVKNRFRPTDNKKK